MPTSEVGDIRGFPFSLNCLKRLSHFTISTIGELVPNSCTILSRIDIGPEGSTMTVVTSFGLTWVLTGKGLNILLNMNIDENNIFND